MILPYKSHPACLSPFRWRPPRPRPRPPSRPFPLPFKSSHYQQRHLYDSDTSKYEYIGCFTDSQEDRVLNDMLTSKAAMSAEVNKRGSIAGCDAETQD